jgi:hypothetical protein
MLRPVRSSAVLLSRRHAARGYCLSLATAPRGLWAAIEHNAPGNPIGVKGTLQPKERGSPTAYSPHHVSMAAAILKVAQRCGCTTSSNPPAKDGARQRPCGLPQFRSAAAPLAVKMPGTTRSD